VGVPITAADLDSLLADGIRQSAFRLEAQPSYAVGIERDALRQFANGNAQPPSEYGWWQEWLDLIAGHSRLGRVIERVRVLADPLSIYQKWLLWGDRWHASAGERIRYLRRNQADAIGLPVDRDWWLLDATQVVVMRFTPGGKLASTELLTDTKAVSPYRRWRELALQHATEDTT
jgi:hypothetical protein